jgi:hypothetical protein
MCRLDATKFKGVPTMGYRSAFKPTPSRVPIILALGGGILATALTILGSLFF